MEEVVEEAVEGVDVEEGVEVRLQSIFFSPGGGSSDVM